MTADAVVDRRQLALEHISAFRSQKFDLQGNEEVLVRENPLARDLQESIATLARDLYAKDTHFIFELIQNAEDNAYAPGETPSLSFRLCRNDPTGTPGAKGALIIENNEFGFSREHVEALCAVGKSTKRKAQGFIGEKGIGFKSIFRVTSNPHVFSNGYSFRLPEEHRLTGLGYIVPCWVDRPPPEVDPPLTTIILPLDQPNHSFDSIAGYIRQVAPETILFLSKLRRLRLYIEGEYDAYLTKDDSAAPLVHLSYRRCKTGQVSDGKPTEFTYWVVAHTFDKPEGVIAEKRENVSQSEVTVAFPLEASARPIGRVFAYLPVCDDAGLPFLVNADFLLATSREAVKEDEPWNKWLRTCIGEVFLEAFFALLQRTDKRQVAYSFIPLSLHQPFLQPIAEEIQSALRKRKSIWCEGGEGFRSPSECVMAPTHFRTLFSTSPGPAHLHSRPLVKREIERWKQQLDNLGVESLTKDDILACLKDIEWLASRPLDWFVLCYSYLKDKADLSGLERCPIIPVEDGRLSCDAQQPIYFSCDDDTLRLLESLPKHARVPLAFLSVQVLAQVQRIPGLTKWMTDTLRIYDFSRSNYSIDVAAWITINSHTLSDSELVRATEFLATFSDQPARIDDIPLLLGDGTRKPLSELKDSCQHIATPVANDPESGWQHTFASTADRSHLAVLSDEYIYLLGSSDSQQAVLAFLFALGVTDAPRPCRSKKVCYVQRQSWDSVLYLNTQLSEHERTIVLKYRHKSANSRLGEMTVTDSVPPKWLEEHGAAPGTPIECAVARYRSMRRLLCEYVVVVEKELSYYRDKTAVANGLSAEVRYRNYDWFSPCEPSAFLFHAQRHPWLLTSQGLLPPVSVFVDSPDVRQILGDSVAYVERPLPGEVAAFLGLRLRITAEEILSTLLDNSERNTDNVVLARKAFQYLNSLDDFPESVKQRLQTERVICVPTAHGNWFSASETIWADRAEVLGEGFVYLENVYPKLKEFFITALGVKEDVDPECYARQWLTLQATAPDLGERVRGVLSIIYRELLGAIKRGSAHGGKAVPLCEQEAWWVAFVREAKVWCQDGVFCPPNECYVPDDGELQRLFRSQQIHFVGRPDRSASFSDYEPIFRSLGIPYLSESVGVRLIDEADPVEVDSPRFMTTGARVWILTCLKERYPNEYERSVAAELHRSLWNTRECKAQRLILEYTIGLLTCTEDYSAFWDQLGKRLIHRGDDTRKGDVAEQVAKGILSDRRYKDFAEQIEVAIGEFVAEVLLRIRRRNWAIPAEVRELLGEAAGDGEDEREQRRDRRASDDEPLPSDRRTTGEGDEVDEYGDDEPESQAGTMSGVEGGRGPAEASKPVPAGKEEPSSGTAFDYLESFGKAFQKHGLQSGEGSPLDPFEGVVNPPRRRERTRQEILDERDAEPHLQERFAFVPIKRWEPKNDVTRVKLREWYGGRCQICGTTFQKRDGTPYFEGLYIVSRKRAAWIDRPGNVLCLCANCCAKFQHGTVEATQDIGDQLRSLRAQAEGGTGETFIEVMLCGQIVRIGFDERHLIDLQSLLAVADTGTTPGLMDSDEQSVKQETPLEPFPRQAAGTVLQAYMAVGDGDSTSGLPDAQKEPCEGGAQHSQPPTQDVEPARTEDGGTGVEGVVPSDYQGPLSRFLRRSTD